MAGWWWLAETGCSCLTRGRAALPGMAMVWMTYPPDDPSGLVDAVAASGVDGFLTPLPARSYAGWARQLGERGVDYIHFLDHDPRLKDVEAANLRLADIAASGTGVKVEKGRFSGDIDIRGVRAGVPSSNTAKDS